MKSLACILIFGLATYAFAADRRPVALNPVASTDSEIMSGEYKFDPSIHSDVLAGIETEMWARAYWPKDLKANRPILFFLHGNHSTCGTLTTPRSDWDCTYTTEGVCPTGMTVVQNHAGFEYLGKHFASLGYIVVSINANRGITCNEGEDEDSGLILARGRLVLKHIELWKNWATAGGAPKSLGIAAETFIDKVDFKQVGLMGHSRGGEGVRAAYNLYREENSRWREKIPGLLIRGIFEIGSVDGQSNRVLNAEDTAWSALIPMCDGDVSDFAGRLPFERMMSYTRESRKTPKSISMVWGANHNFFNSEWQENDSYGCFNHSKIFGDGPESKEQQAVAVQLTTAFFVANVGNDRISEQAQTLDPVWTPAQSLLNITRIDRYHIYTLDEAYRGTVDNFDRTTGTSSAGINNEAVGVNIENIEGEPNRVRVAWQSPSADRFLQLNANEPGQGRDIGHFESLDFRVRRMLAEESHSALDFEISLAYADGSFSDRVAVSEFSEIVGPATQEDLFQTIRIPLKEFSPKKEVRGIRFTFNKTGQDKVEFAQVRFGASLKAEIEPDVELPALSPSFGKFGMGTASPPPAMTLFLSNSRAVIGDVRSVKKHGSRAIEIAVTSTRKPFPVESSLPTLFMGGSAFTVSRHEGPRRIVFTIPLKDWVQLPLKGPMHVQYGTRKPTKVWQMPRYDLSSWSI